ncbi:MAG TPA: hypothetical protein VHF50_06900 [Solirubrobacterales bacterium]|nr:hypothetical protein [Solirubrobacterales bacterium]
MSRQIASSARREGGTASVELIAVVPVLLLAVLVAAQLVAVGQALWSAGAAARAGARADLVGGDATRAARRALPEALRTGAEVTSADGVVVRVVVPRLLPTLPRLTVESGTRLDGGDD